MRKVLVVEDNELNFKLFCDLLAIQNCITIASKTGARVKELAEEEQPDLILMDIQLNGYSGIDLIRELKAHKLTAHIPIIAITAFAMKQDEEDIMKSGCDLYISKPVSINRFFEAINIFLKKSE